MKHSNRPITLVSSVGGFSRPAIEGIRTLHDLLRSIKPLKLQRYEGAQLQEARFLGEGVSYNVYKSTDVRSGLVVAVKKVKLPPAPASLTAFRSRIGCILKDIEVMSHLPLAQHPNILNILGYGWESQGEGLLPFIVTECATLGNLREYLTKSTTDAKRRRELCYQVASGLHGLHLSGVAHGDLKLENVLVTLAAADQVGPRRGPRREPVLAKLVCLPSALFQDFCFVGGDLVILSDHFSLILGIHCASHRARIYLSRHTMELYGGYTYGITRATLFCSVSGTMPQR